MEKKVTKPKKKVAKGSIALLEKQLQALKLENERLQDQNIILLKEKLGKPLLKTSDDLLFDPKQERMWLRPIQYNAIWNMYLKHRALFWTEDEIDLSKDRDDWIKLKDEERYFLKIILAFFSASDFIVNKNLESGDFIENIKILEAQIYYRFQKMIEDVHSSTYSMLLDEYIKDPKEFDELNRAVETIPTIKKKAEWAKKWIDHGTMTERIVAFSIVEGIFFSGSFSAIFWFKKRGILRGLTFSNELISRDEGIHRDVAILLYNNYIKNKLDTKVVIKMIKEAVEIEKEFIRYALPKNLVGMNSDLMAKNIESVADNLSFNLINDTIYNTKCPFDWMMLLNTQTKTNFFEDRVAEYSIQMSLIKDTNENKIVFDAEF